MRGLSMGESEMTISPTGLTVRAPWGELRFDAGGVHVAHSETFSKQFEGWTVGDLRAEIDRLGTLLKAKK